MSERDVEELEAMMKKMVAIKGTLYVLEMVSVNRLTFCRNGRGYGRGRAQAVCGQGSQRPDERPLREGFLVGLDDCNSRDARIRYTLATFDDPPRMKLITRNLSRTTHASLVKRSAQEANLADCRQTMLGE